MRLDRLQRRREGIFGDLSINGEHLAQTLEHAYESADGQFYPKIPAGTYTCKRGAHRLHGMDHDFETFQILDVPGCFGILFHCGNFNRDSEGCVLLGNSVTKQENGEQMLTGSKDAFARFMARLEGQETFELTVA